MIYHVVNFKNIRFKTLMIRSDLCDYSDIYIVVKGTRTVKGYNDADKRNKKSIFKNNASFRSCLYHKLRTH